MAWLDFAPSDAGLEEFGVRHGIHTLHLEDCRSDEQQAKIEHGDGYLFIVLKLVLLTSDELSAADLDVFLGADYVATVHKSPVPLLTQSIANVNGAALPSDEILYRVLDAVVDSYLPVLEDVEDRIDLLEDLVVRRPDRHSRTDSGSADNLAGLCDPPGPGPTEA